MQHEYISVYISFFSVCFVFKIIFYISDKKLLCFKNLLKKSTNKTRNFKEPFIINCIKFLSRNQLRVKVAKYQTD